MSFLSLRGVAKGFGAVRALDGIDLDIEQGARAVIVGASGSGKTTLLRLIAGFEMPDRGTIVLGGETVADGPSGVAVHRRGIAFVAQDGGLFPHLTVAENIGFAIPRGDRGREARIRELMDLVELDMRTRDRAPHELSGGQQQRVAIARGLARDPKLMLLDEPFSALDAGLRESVRNAAARVLATAGVTTILVTHDQAEALSFADQLAVLTLGRLAQAGPPRDVYMRPRTAETAVFLGDAIIIAAVVANGWAESPLGRIAVSGAGFEGRAEIMLRPEQLRLSPLDTAEGSGLAGRVVKTAFGGSISQVVLAVSAGPGSPEVAVTVRVASHDAPEPGARVRVTVSGAAHVIVRSSAADGPSPAHL